LVVDGKIGILRNQYHHYTYGNISDQIQTIDKYSKIAAEELFENGEKFSLFNLLFHPPFRFIKEYLFKSGFRDGLPGLIIIVSTMFYVFIKYAKLWELTRSTTPSPSFEDGGEMRRPGSTSACGRQAERSVRNFAELRRAPKAEGLTIFEKEKENGS
jgi:hypothetical protein